MLTPLFIESWGIAGTQLAYGLLAALSAVLFFIFGREKPLTPPGPLDQQERALMLDGLKSLVKSKPFWVLMVLFLIGNGIFNGLSTWIESIVRPRGFTPAQAGVLGGLLLLGGILGAIVLSTLSDKTRKRKLFLLIGMLASIPGLIGLTFAQSYGLLLFSTFSFGFFMISTAPIGYQYAAELTYPGTGRYFQWYVNPDRSDISGLHLRYGSLKKCRWIFYNLLTNSLRTGILKCAGCYAARGTENTAGSRRLIKCLLIRLPQTAVMTG